MSTIPTPKTFTQEDLMYAKKAGFRKKKPKKGKTPKTFQAMHNKVSLYNAWVDELKQKAKEGRAMVAAKKKFGQL